MLGRRELLVLLTEVELPLLRCERGTSRCSSRAVAKAIFSRFSCVIAARLGVLVVDDDDDDDNDDDDREDEEDEWRMDLNCSSSSGIFGRGAAPMIL